MQLSVAPQLPAIRLNRILDLREMVSGRDDLVDIDAEGTARPRGEAASLRLQARAGSFHVWPGPPDLLVMRRAQTDGADARSCTLCGEIQSAGALCDVVSLVANTGKRGELVVVSAEVSRSIYFDQGHVVGAQSTAINERLGEVLYRQGVLTREQVKECSEMAATGALRFGEAAVKKDFITRERLFALMARQTEEIFHGMLFESTGVFYFLDSYDDAQLSFRHQLSVTALIREGVRRAHETRFFRARIPSQDHIPMWTEGRVRPESDPLGLCAAIDGARSVFDLCRVLGTGEFEVTRALFQLIQSGQIIMRPPRLGPEAVVAVYNQAISLLLCELDAMDEGDNVRAQLAAFAARDGVYTALFAGAGPSDDGTLNAAGVIENLKAAPDVNEAEQRLASCLHEYASYALFLARPHLRRLEQARGAEKVRVSKRVTALLEPIAPAVGQSGGSDPQSQRKIVAR
jgi:hypothetical protein